MSVMGEIGVGQFAFQAGQWCILRTSGRSTLKLAETLAADGFEVWTPAEVRKMRLSRSNVRREVSLPIMPSYVFAKADRLADLREMERMPVKPRRGIGWGKPAHADFTIMRFCGDFCMVSDVHLTALRRIEQVRELHRIRSRKVDPLPKGVIVRVKEGAHTSWGGMIGKVVKSNPKSTVIEFTSAKYDVVIPTSLLSLDDIGR